MTFMRSLFHDEPSSSSRVRRTAYASIVLHALVLVLMVTGIVHVHRTLVLVPRSRGSITAVSVVAANRGALASILAAKAPPAESPTARPMAGHKPNPAPAKLKPELSLKDPAESQRATAGRAAYEKSSPGIAGVGTDTQSMYPAYPVVSPSPQVRDRSLLPSSDQRVVVDVSLGTDGQVQEAKLVSGLGNSLDQIVLDTVRGWQFHPATVNGTPVASSIELIFPFNRNYPIAE